MIVLKENQHAMWHPHELSLDEVDYIIRHLNAVEVLNDIERFLNCFTDDDRKKYSYLKKEMEVFISLKTKLDVWTK